MTATSEVGLVEATLLAKSLVAHLTQGASLRALAIKGVTAELQGVRPRKISTDTDVLVHPDDFDEVVALLGRRGWEFRHRPLEPAVISPHSLSMLHQGWPCDIDVHRSYPGFLADPATVFEALWKRRTVINVAQTAVETTDRAGTILVLALHALRAPYLDANQLELDNLARRVQEMSEPEDLDDLVCLAQQTGSIQTAGPFFERVGIRVPKSTIHNEAYKSWLAVTSDRNRTALWLLQLRRSSWRHKPKVLWHAVFPSESELRSQHPGTPPGRFSLVALRTRRLVGGLKALPRALNTLMRRSGRPN